MASRKTSRHTNKGSRGFTLIEVVTVIGILAVITGMTLVFGLEGLRGYTFRTDRDTLIAALQRARAEAMGNVCLGTACTDGKVHGVKIESGKFIIFQGASYATRDVSVDEVIDSNTALSYGGTVSEIVFGQLSGTSSAPSGVSEPWTMTLTDVTGRSSQITIESEGQIVWTH